MVAWPLAMHAHACPALRVPILVGWLHLFFSPARLQRPDIAVVLR